MVILFVCGEIDNVVGIKFVLIIWMILLLFNVIVGLEVVFLYGL